MKANLAQREPEWLKRWQAMDLHNTLVKRHQDRPMFIMHDGPPYANGRLHVGHALNKILKDIVCKSKILSGFNAPFIPGWDCHGLPIELNVEKKVGKVGDKVNVEQFHQACRKYAASQVNNQRDEFVRMGILADWQNPYLTLESGYEANIVRLMANIIEQGHLQKGEKPVHWCPLCGSALAEAEVEYKDKQSPSIDVAFVAVDRLAMAGCFAADAGQFESIIVPIWTTTPWTLPANQAVSMNAELDYVLLKTGDIGYILAESLAESAMQRYGLTDYETVAMVKGQELSKQQLQHPFLDRQVPIILGDHVTTEAGTGNVHTAPAHGPDDFVVGQEYCLPVDSPINAKSCFKDDIPFIGGMHIYKANDPIIEVLKKNNVLLYLARLEHSYPHCWRHKSPLIFRATPQWFISMDKQGLRDSALEQIKQVQWIPTWGENRITRMIADRPDWCVSRQRTWGTPLALFLDKDSGEPHPDSVNLMRRVADLIEQGGIEAWQSVQVEDFLSEADAQQYIKCKDTLDVWFDSGSSHACVLNRHPLLHSPADLYLEGSDQHRGWFHSSLLTSTAAFGYAPYKAVLTHGYIVDGEGRKMSKSIGNIVSPDDIIKKFGADMLRLWVASTDYQNDVRFSDEIFKRNTDAYRRIRNTARFLLSNLEDFVPDNQVALEDMVAIDRWAVAHTALVQEKIIEAYNAYQFHTIYQLIHNFCAVEMGSFYLDIIKDRQYTAKANSHARRSSQSAMFHIVEAMVRWLAPILSFTADEIWQCLPGKRDESVFYDHWYGHLSDEAVDMAKWQALMQARDEVNKVLEARRGAGDIRSALDAGVTLYADESWLPILQSLKDELRFLLITSAASVKALADAPADSAATEADGLSVVVDVLSEAKCERCWQHRSDVGQNERHSTICQRCVENIDGHGEQRLYV